MSGEIKRHLRPSCEVAEVRKAEMPSMWEYKYSFVEEQDDTWKGQKTKSTASSSTENTQALQDFFASVPCNVINEHLGVDRQREFALDLRDKEADKKERAEKK